MIQVKTVHYFVSGSMKEFHIYKCTVDSVEEGRDSKDRKQISATIGDTTYKGLFNKKVYEHLCANEGTESFVVLWPTGKGNYMLAYSWSIWEDYIEGNEPEADTLEPEPVNSKEAFVYMWTNKDDGRMYIGTHKGTPDDGYIASGTLFMEDYNKDPSKFSRNILAYGTAEEMLHLETVLLLHLKARTSYLYYNISDNLRA